MTSKKSVPVGIKSKEIIAHLAEQVKSKKIKAYKLDFQGENVALEEVDRINHTSAYYLEADNGARYVFDHNSWQRADSSSGSATALFLVNDNFDPSNCAHYDAQLRIEVNDGFYVAKLTSRIDDAFPGAQETSLHGVHDPSKDGLIDYFFRKAK